MAIGGGVFPWKPPLPGVGHELAGWPEFIAPGIEVARKSAPGRKFPLGFRREPLAGPRCEGSRILVGNLHHGIIATAMESPTNAGGENRERCIMAGNFSRVNSTVSVVGSGVGAMCRLPETRTPLADINA